jgi:hypothetical protein
MRSKIADFPWSPLYMSQFADARLVAELCFRNCEIPRSCRDIRRWGIPSGRSNRRLSKCHRLQENRARPRPTRFLPLACQRQVNRTQVPFYCRTVLEAVERVAAHLKPASLAASAVKRADNPLRLGATHKRLAGHRSLQDNIHLRSPSNRRL